MNALVIADLHPTRMMAARKPGSLRFETVQAAEGQRALVESSGSFDIALVDWSMSVMSGWELVRAVRKDRAYDEMATMTVAIASEQSQVLAASEVGASGYLMKPFPQESVEEMRKILGLGA